MQTDDNINEELCKLGLEEEDMKSAGTLLPTFLPSDVFMASAKLKKGKSNGGKSTIVAEMLKALPLVFIFLIYKIFFQRYLGHQVEHVVSWCSIILSFINKEAKPTNMTHFRGVCLLDILATFHVSVGDGIEETGCTTSLEKRLHLCL